MPVISCRADGLSCEFMSMDDIAGHSQVAEGLYGSGKFRVAS